MVFCVLSHQAVIPCDKRHIQSLLRYYLMDKLHFCSTLSLYQEMANLTSDVVMCAKMVPLMEKEGALISRLQQL